MHTSTTLLVDLMSQSSEGSGIKESISSWHLLAPTEHSRSRVLLPNNASLHFYATVRDKSTIALARPLHFSYLKVSISNFFFFKPQEDELREKCDTRFAHLHDDLHVEITAYAPAPEAYLRISNALFEIKRFLVPVSAIRSQ